MRWGIEAMFSDFKSRGLRLNQSQIQKPDRLERLTLIMSIPAECSPRRRPAAKKGGSEKALGSPTSLFKAGLRLKRRYTALKRPVPRLWAVWNERDGVKSEI